MGLVDDVKGRAVGIEHVCRGDRDVQEDLLDVRLQREVALELEQRLELLGLAERCHPHRILAQLPLCGERSLAPVVWRAF